MTPPVTYTLTIEDIRAFRKRRRPGRLAAILGSPWLTVVLYGATAGLAAVTLRLQLRRDHLDIGEVTQASLFTGAGAAVALVAALGAVERRRKARLADLRLVAKGPIEMRGDDARLEIRQGDLSSAIAWTSLDAIELTPSHVFVCTGPERAILVPRSALAGTALGALLMEKARGGRATLSQ